MDISNEQVMQAVQDVHPDPVRKIAVTINGIDYPVNQAFALVTGADRLDCNTGVARRLFQNLGFTVKRVA